MTIKYYKLYELGPCVVDEEAKYIPTDMDEIFLDTAYKIVSRMWNPKLKILSIYLNKK